MWVLVVQTGVSAASDETGRTMERMEGPSRQKVRWFWLWRRGMQGLRRMFLRPRTILGLQFRRRRLRHPQRRRSCRL